MLPVDLLDYAMHLHVNLNAANRSPQTWLNSNLRTVRMHSQTCQIWISDPSDNFGDGPRMSFSIGKTSKFCISNISQTGSQTCEICIFAGFRNDSQTHADRI